MTPMNDHLFTIFDRLMDSFLSHHGEFVGLETARKQVRVFEGLIPHIQDPDHPIHRTVDWAMLDATATFIEAMADADIVSRQPMAEQEAVKTIGFLLRDWVSTHERADKDGGEA